jgi:hypothetical protein
MRTGNSRNHFLLVLPALFTLVGCLPLCSTVKANSNSTTHIFIRENVSVARRNELLRSLRRITGWLDLNFEQGGSLQLGNREPLKGSTGAQELLTEATFGEKVIVIEDASSRSDIAFCKVVPGKWLTGASDKLPAYVVLIDFTDFEKITGDEKARAAFDVGWGFLHELDHVVNDSDDSYVFGLAGECEEHINKMRRELDLPIRTNYFFAATSFRSDPNFPSRFVSLSFEHSDRLTHKTRQYRLTWDSNLVGGFNGSGQTALVLSSPSK